ncbi:MAG: hypothetical protein ACXIUQ_13830 [Cecembia sp.]
MKIIKLKGSEKEFAKLNLSHVSEMELTQLVEKIEQELAKNALLACQKYANEAGLDNLSLDEINKEIDAARNKDRS